MAELRGLPAPPNHSFPPVLPPRTVRVGVVDTEPSFVQVLVKRFEAMEWQHRCVAGPLPPQEIVALRLNSLVVDLARLGPEAWDYLGHVCAELPDLAVLVCTAHSTLAQRVRGLRLGADDWVTKPCHPEEVIARVEAAVRRRRRSAAPGQSEPIAAGELEIRADQFQAFVDGRSAVLTRREFEVLQMLAGAREQVVQREDIYQRVWGYSMAHGDRSVDVFVRKVRHKLEAVSPQWQYIHTHFGIGYRFQAEPREGHVPDKLPRTAAEGRSVSLAPA